MPLDPARESDVTFADQIVSTALDLSAWELRGTITGLFDRELADPSFYGDLDEVLDELPEGATFEPDGYRFPSPIENTWEEVKTWHFFDELFPARQARRSSRAVPASHLPVIDHPEPSADASLDPVTYRREPPKVGRNDPCPCGKKYKKCCVA